MNITLPGFWLCAAVLVLLYYCVPGRLQWVVLLMASWGFYLRSGAEYLVFLLLTTVTTYLAAVTMDNRMRGLKDAPPEERRQGRGTLRRGNRRILTCYLAVNFGVLLLCKASLTRPVAAALQGGRLDFLTLGLPMGISFYLFQSAGYVMDVYRGRETAQRSLPRLALFVSYFPQLIQGPISRYSALAPQLFSPHRFDGKQVSFGTQRIIWGLFKKLVIADRIAPAVAVLRGIPGGTAFACLSVCYAIQIYADFTGGIDMMLGLSQCFGIILPENFTRPFLSKNTAEYWRRWHITLGEWMKEYIFYPVSASTPLLRLSKLTRNRWGSFGRRTGVYAASAVTWLATGLWHGLTPNFPLWGLLNWAVIVISQELSPLYRKFHSRFHWKEKRWYGWFEVTRMFLLMNLIRVCDLFPDPRDYFRGIASLFSGFSAVSVPCMTALDWGIVGLGCLLMAAVSLVQEKQGSIRALLWEKAGLRYGLLFGLLLAVLLLGRYGVGYDAANFVYNQF